MDLTIVIVNWNGKELLRDCLTSIASSKEPLSLQVIVVDNDSWDGSPEMVAKEFPRFQLINSGGNIGFGRANNLARPFVQSDLVLLLNPDTVLLDHALTRMVEFIRQHPEVGAVGCKMIYPDGEIHEQGLQYFPSPWSESLFQLCITKSSQRRLRKFLPYLDPNSSGYVIKLYGGCLVCHKRALDEIGWFDERYFMYVEDVDLCRTLADRGWKLYYLSSAQIIHVAGGSSRKAPSGFAVLMKCESLSKWMRKYYGRTGSLLYRLGTAAIAVIRLGILGILWLASSLRPSLKPDNLSAAFLKYRLLLLWSFGLRKAMIARRPS